MSTKNHVASILVQRIGNTSQLTSEQLFQATAEALTGIVSVSNFNTALQTAAINYMNQLRRIKTADIRYTIPIPFIHLKAAEMSMLTRDFDHWTRAEHPFLRR